MLNHSCKHQPLVVDWLRTQRALWLIAFVLASLLAAAQPSSSIAILPGMSTERTFGPAVLLIHVDHHLAAVEVTVSLNGQMMKEIKLTPEAAATTLDLVLDKASIKGSLGAQFGWPGDMSVIRGDFQASDGLHRTPFRGDLAIWDSPSPLILTRQTVWITPEIFAETSVFVDASQSVQVRFGTGSVIMVSLTLSQGANSAVVQQGFTVGTAKIQPGMTLQLQIATPTQQGQVLMQGSFSSSNLPQVNYAGAIATWQYCASPQGRKLQ